MSSIKEQSYILPLLNKNHLSATQEGNGTAKPEDGEEERKKKSQPEGDQKQRQVRTKTNKTKTTYKRPTSHNKTVIKSPQTKSKPQ